MKKILLLSLICFFLCSNVSRSCTTFTIKTDDELVFGRNYDFNIGYGLVFINKKGVIKNAMTSQQPGAEWISKYGSVTFNQFGREFPTGGINEAGLVVELMWLDDTKYPAKDERPAMGGVLQWIQYQLDNCETIQEVIDTDKLIRIPTAAVPIHFLITDKYGNSAAYSDGLMCRSKSSIESIESIEKNETDEVQSGELYYFGAFVLLSTVITGFSLKKRILRNR